MVSISNEQKIEKDGKERGEKGRVKRSRVAKIIKEQSSYSQDRKRDMGWREKTTHMHSHVHARISHTCDILTTHTDVHTCTDSASDVSSTHTKAQTTHLLICSQAHTDTTKLCSHIS